MKKILIVDDDDVICEVLERCLKGSGFLIDVAKNGYDLLGYLRSRQEPDIVVLDLMLPERSGLELFNALRSKWQKTEVFIFTGYPQYRDKWLLNGYISGFFPKTDINSLIEAVKKAA